jgi:hypothetical protein
MLRHTVCAVIGLVLLAGAGGAADTKAKKSKNCRVEGYILKFLEGDHTRFQVKAKTKKIHTIHCTSKTKVIGPKGGKRTLKELKTGDPVLVTGIHGKKNVCEAREIKLRVRKKGGK